MEIAAHEKRAFPRKFLRGSGEIGDALSESRKKIEMLDISAGGIAFLSPSSFPKGDLLIVRFHLIDSGEISAVIRITYCVRHSLVDMYRVGAEFKKLDNAQMNTIQQYLG